MAKRIVTALQSLLLFPARHGRLLAVVFFSLFLMQRCGLLFFGFSHLSFPYCDEVSSGVLACDLIDNSIRAPLLTYQFEARSGDSLLEGFLLVPLFKIMGRSLFSLKVLALISSSLCLLGWVAFIARYQGMSIALLFTLLFALPPPMFALLNLTGTIGSHHLINPLMVVHLIVLFRIIDADTSSASWPLWLGMGFLSGLGTYIFYSYLIFAIFCCLFLLVFRLKQITFHRLLLLGAGFLAGLFLWFVRSYHSTQGGRSLYALLSSFKIDAWGFIQTFLFNVPDSLGYHYPSRSMGIVSPLFFIFIVLLSVVIAARIWRTVITTRAGSLIQAAADLSTPELQDIFLITFPPAFISCVALSHPITPFEYVPYIGFFTRYSASVYYYRWLHILFPFYFAIAAVGTITLVRAYPKRVTIKATAVSLFAFFPLCSVVNNFTLYSTGDAGKIFCYKGYNYDYLANRFMVSDFASQDAAKAEIVVLNYPQEAREAAYQCLGEKEILNAVSGSFEGKRFEERLDDIPAPYLKDFIYGAVWRAHFLPGQAFQPFADTMARKYPDRFYENWGHAYLGYKYYTFLLNLEKILGLITPAERFFFDDFIRAFSQLHSNRGREAGTQNLLQEIRAVPPDHQPDAVRGLGKLVGGAMLRDPFSAPDYPLDSRRFGEALPTGLREAFYEGVGGGFADVLCQFWRTLLLPDDPALPLYAEMLDMEWGRCHTLMAKLSPSHYPLVARGFRKELEERSLPAGIRAYLSNKGIVVASKAPSP
jgi:hypothetical protein